MLLKESWDQGVCPLKYPFPLVRACGPQLRSAPFFPISNDPSFSTIKIWEPWGSWSLCSSPCQDPGIQTRKRLCGHQGEEPFRPGIEICQAKFPGPITDTETRACTHSGVCAEGKHWLEKKIWEIFLPLKLRPHGLKSAPINFTQFCVLLSSL